MCWELYLVIEVDQAWQGVQKLPKIVTVEPMQKNRGKRGKEWRVRHNKQAEIILQVPVFQRQQDNCIPELGSHFMKGYLPADHRSEVMGQMAILVFSGSHPIRGWFWDYLFFGDGGGATRHRSYIDTWNNQPRFIHSLESTHCHDKNGLDSTEVNTKCLVL